MFTACSQIEDVCLINAEGWYGTYLLFEMASESYKSVTWINWGYY